MILKEQLTKRKGLPVINLSQPGNEIYQLPPENDQDRLWTQRNQWQCPFIVVSYQDIINLKQKLDNQCL